jgi:hypothetical protein
MPPPPRFRFTDGGTRFRLYPQPARLGFAPLTVHVDAPPGSILTGPRDATIQTIDAVAKLGYRKDDTEAIRGRPPYQGRRRLGVRPAAGGHFHHAEPGTREFGLTTTFAAVRLVLEIWRHYLERPLRWHFADTVSLRLELFPTFARTTPGPAMATSSSAPRTIRTTGTIPTARTSRWWRTRRATSS